MDPFQTGFVKELVTQINILKLLEKIKSYKKINGNKIPTKKMSILFIDFRSAFNTLNRNKLYEILRAKKILDNLEVEFLEKMHQKLYFETKKGKIHFQNGVHQGSAISPALFDIFAEDFIE